MMKNHVLTKPCLYKLNHYEIGKIQKRTTWWYVDGIAKLELAESNNPGETKILVTFHYHAKHAAKFPSLSKPFDFFLQPADAEPPYRGPVIDAEKFKKMNIKQRTEARIFEKADIGDYMVDGVKMALYYCL